MCSQIEAQRGLPSQGSRADGGLELAMCSQIEAQRLPSPGSCADGGLIRMARSEHWLNILNALLTITARSTPNATFGDGPE